MIASNCLQCFVTFQSFSISWLPHFQAGNSGAELEGFEMWRAKQLLNRDSQHNPTGRFLSLADSGIQHLTEQLPCNWDNGQ